MCLTLNLFRIFIESYFNNQISNNWYFIFNLCCILTKTSSSSKASNTGSTRCFVFSLCSFFSETSLFNYFSLQCLSSSFCVLEISLVALGILELVALTFVKNLSSSYFALFVFTTILSLLKPAEIVLSLSSSIYLVYLT